MTPAQIIAQVQNRNLPEGEYLVFGSAPMCMRGIRECEDIDLLVSPRTYEDLKSKGWKERNTKIGRMLIREPFEVSADWKFGAYNPSLKELLPRANVFGGIPFASLEDVIAWKTAFGREKDKTDLRLINDHLRREAA